MHLPSSSCLPTNIIRYWSGGIPSWSWIIYFNSSIEVKGSTLHMKVLPVKVFTLISKPPLWFTIRGIFLNSTLLETWSTNFSATNMEVVESRIWYLILIYSLLALCTESRSSLAASLKIASPSYLRRSISTNLSWFMFGSCIFIIHFAIYGNPGSQSFKIVFKVPCATLSCLVIWSTHLPSWS